MAQIMNKWADFSIRTIFAILMLAIFALAILFNTMGILILLLFVSPFAVWEIGHIIRLRPMAQALSIAIAMLGILGLIADISTLFFTPFLLWVVFLLFASTYRTPMIAAFAVFFIFGIQGFITIALYYGTFTVVALVLVVIASDVAGYFAGRFIGGPKIFPTISPKKTWSGTAAGWICAAPIGLMMTIEYPGQYWLMLLAVILCMAAQAGDIFESAFKRCFNVKDSSWLLPGHGGVLDRFDGLLGAGIFALLIHILLQLLSFWGYGPLVDVTGSS